MSIKALAILFTASAMAATPVSAEQADQNGSPLPQFMSSAGRAQLEQRVQETKPVSHETRQSAEILSARFAGTLSEPDPDAGNAKPESAPRHTRRTGRSGGPSSRCRSDGDRTLNGS